MTVPYQDGHLLILGGNIGRLLKSNRIHHEISVDKSKGGRPPLFGGQEGPKSDVVVAKMRRVYQDINIPIYLDTVGIDLLHQARKSFVSHGLMEHSIIPYGNGFILFPWLGSAGLMTLQLALMTHGLIATIHSIAIEVQVCDIQHLRDILGKIASNSTIEIEKMAMLIPEKTIDKFDHYLDSELQAMNFASAMLDASALQDKASELLKSLL